MQRGQWLFLHTVSQAREGKGDQNAQRSIMIWQRTDLVSSPGESCPSLQALTEPWLVHAEDFATLCKAFARLRETIPHGAHLGNMVRTQGQRSTRTVNVLKAFQNLSKQAPDFFVAVELLLYDQRAQRAARLCVTSAVLHLDVQHLRNGLLGTRGYSDVREGFARLPAER